MKRKFLYFPLTFIALSGLFVSNSCANKNADNQLPEVEYKLNQSIDYSGIKWTVSGVKDFGNKLTTEDFKGFDGTIDDTLASGRFIYVYWWIENSSGKDIANPSSPTIIDEKNIEYKVFNSFVNWEDKIPGAVGGPELGMPVVLENRTIPYYCAAFYDVPTDAKELKLKIPDLMNENSKIVMVNLIDFKEDFAFMGKLVSVEEASDLMGTRIPLPSYLPEGYAVQEIYIGFSNKTTIILISDRPIEKIDREPPDIPKDYPIHLVKCPLAMYVSFSHDLRITGGNAKPTVIPIELHKMSDGGTFAYSGIEIDGRIASLMLNAKPEISSEDITKILLSMK